MQKIRTLLAAGVLSLCGAQAQAGIIFNNGASNPTNYGANFSEATYRQADNIALASAATVRSVTFWGGYWSSGVIPAVESFSINFYAAGATPGALIGTSTLDLISRVDTGFNHNGYAPADIWEFTADLVKPISLAAGSYWMSVFVPVDQPGTSFYWQETGVDGAPGVKWAASYYGGASWSVSSYGGEKAFNLSDTFAGSNGNDVPEPAGLSLAALGLAALALRRRKR